MADLARDARPLEVCVHHLKQARAVLAAAEELGAEVRLRSAPGAAGYAGVGWLKALGEAIGQDLVIDCGDDAGLVMAALRVGCRDIVFSGDAMLAGKLADMAGQVGAILRHETGAAGVLLLEPEDDATRLRAWLEQKRCQTPFRKGKGV